MSNLAADPKQKPGYKTGKGKGPANGNTPHGKNKKSGGGWFSRLFMLAISIGLIGALGGVLLIAGVLFYFNADLPDYKTLANYEPPIVTRAYAGDGRLLAEFAAEKRVFVPIEAIPERVIQAFLSAEDKNFYKHPGLDFLGIARAAVHNVKNYGSGRLQGASTITQQVAKNFLLTNERSFERKIKEAILAFRIEQTFDKDHILELYLNEIFLGARAYGVAAASLEYFAKPLDALSLEEVAYLAALPKAPNNYHPERKYDAAVGRRNWVMSEMLDNGYITAEDAAAAKEKPLVVTRRSTEEYVNFPYFAEEVRRKLLELYGEKGLYEGGLIARTTMRPKYQKAAEKALRVGLVAYDQRHGLHSKALASISTAEDKWQEELGAIELPPGGHVFERAVILKTGTKTATLGFVDGGTGIVTYDEMKWARGKNGTPSKVSSLLKAGDVWLFEKTDKKQDGKAVYGLRQIPAVQGGIIALDPHTGRIFAIAGGFSYEMSQFNRASQAVRQPGSAFKPFVYLSALEQGFTPATLVLDAPFVFDQGGDLGEWRPQNYNEDFFGPTTLRRGLEKSRNLMTVRLANYATMERIAETAQRFGVMTDMPHYLSYALGAGETTLLRMAAGYAVFVNGGKKVAPTLLDRIQDRNGKTIYVHDKIPCPDCGDRVPWNEQAVPDVPDTRPEIADPRHMYQMVSMLEGVVQRGTGVFLKSLARPVAGKTGTTNESKDTWFIGFTPDLVVGTYVGFDEPKPMGDKETGSRVAVPIIKTFLEDILKDEPAVPFRVPSGIRLVEVNPENGTRSKGEEGAVLEAFVEGTEPGDEPVMFDGKKISTVSDVTKASEGVNTGLGGLY
ncbi:MAG: penicillin-binding protein 1A [Alphaproteobacteria bacterium]|nr:penicillin-binding protein 1A [Alphaproteobacteria bacterium]